MEMEGGRERSGSGCGLGQENALPNEFASSLDDDDDEVEIRRMEGREEGRKGREMQFCKTPMGRT